jgi:hypothetical protein
MTFGVQGSIGNFNNNLTFGNGQPLGASNLKNLDSLKDINNHYDGNGFGSDSGASLE